MATRCVICCEENVEAGHEETKKHQKNAGLNQLAKYKKLFAENKDGIMVTCTASPTAYNSEPLWCNKEQSKLEVSVKPLEEIRFIFEIKNNNPHEIVFGGVSMLNGRQLNFVLNNDSVLFGTSALRIPPNQILQEQVSITFENHIVGVYKMPVNFYFTNEETETSTIIIKEMVVFVEQIRKTHEKITSPFTQEPVYADAIEPSTGRRMKQNEYPVPSKDHKIVFAHHLKADAESLNEEQQALAESISAILEAGPTPDNYEQYFHNLLWFEETIVAQNLMNYNMSGVSLVLRGSKGKSYALKVPGLAEKRPSLLLGDLVHVRPHGQTKILFEAIVTDIEDNYALFGQFSSKFNPKKGVVGYYSPDAKFDVRFFVSRVPAERMHAAVAGVQTTDANNKIFPWKNKATTIKAIARRRYFNEQVAANPEQRTVVEHVVGGSSGAAPYLLFGPPGTGKTVTIVEAILQLARDPCNSILVCTDSNMAADHVATKLLQYRECFPDEDNFILRANSKDRIWESMPACLAPYSNGIDRISYYSVSIKVFLSYRIVVTTLIHAAKYGRELATKDYERKTTHVFIDEAAQASEPAALVPVCGLLARAGTLVLAGDPQQLGPVCISREAKERGLGVSLMERLKKTCALYSDENPDPNYMVMLKKNFRSHADILSIPSELFYNGQLEALADVDPISSRDIIGERTESRAIVFHGVLSSEQRMGKSPSFFNSMELEIVQSYVLALVKQHNVAQPDIGVITPYMRQVSKIKAWLRAASLGNIEVGTVEAFQGKEKRVMVVSCVRANCDLFAHDAKYRLGFLVDAKRFNVAMTRAKAKLIVIGNPLCLRKDERWRKYMQKCREFGTYTGFDTDLEETDADRDVVLDQITPMIKTMIEAIKLVKL